ncbi:hypothetical protein B0T22DRAFT_456178 [Podospora appendiculata]|uniref:Uncharacterized protein n=1 Tax=Podospora appendiculata TaxID=314037 RepID=A0AAE0XM12_9PEZI|nr:hypothetical protein B0T22DRAFT_456178 [Podospora appendiculata]
MMMCALAMNWLVILGGQRIGRYNREQRASWGKVQSKRDASELSDCLPGERIGLVWTLSGKTRDKLGVRLNTATNYSSRHARTGMPSCRAVVQ